MQEDILKNISMSLNSLDLALEQFNNLTLLSSKYSDDFNVYQKSVYKIAFESISNTCTYEQYELSLEDLKEGSDNILVRIWQKIKQAFLDLWNYIKSFFNHQEEIKITKEIKSKEPEILKITEEAPNNVKFDTPKFIERHELNNFFSYENEEEVSGKYVIEKINALNQSLDKIKNLTAANAEFLLSFSELLKEFSTGEMSFFDKNHYQHHVFAINQSASLLEHFIKDNFSVLPRIDFNSLKNLDVDLRHIDASHSCYLDVLLNNKVLCFYKTNEPEYDVTPFKYIVTLQSVSFKKRLTVQIKYLSKEEFIEYYNALDKMNHSLIQSNTDIYNNLMVIKSITENYMNNLDTYIDNIKKDGAMDYINYYVKVGRSVLNISKNAVLPIETFMKNASIDRRFYSELLFENIKHYSKI